MQFAKLDDSPMFRKQLHALEESAEALRERCQRFYKGCRKYTDGLGEAYDGDIAFANALETFGGGHDDPISVAVGGPVMTRFTIALREIGTYKEVLRSQVEHMLNDRLTQFVSTDLQDVKNVKELRKRFDKASLHYDQVREKFLSLKKDAKPEIVVGFEEDLRNAKSQFEQTRFNLMTALSNIEAKKKFEFLEAVSGSMDAHLRYFKQGYELLHQMEPYIHQVLTYAQQSRERANSEQVLLADRMQEYRRQMERDNQRSFSSNDVTPAGDGIQAAARSSHKMIEAVMQSTPRGKVQTIKQGYILKRSSNLRGDWKRRFFVLDSRGMLYYYRKQWGKPTDDKTIAHHTVNLLTSTIKVDAEQSDLRFCFRIISPSKTLTLQAENAIDRMDWMDKITGVIASLLNNQIPEQRPYRSPMGLHQRTGSETSTLSASSEYDGSEDTVASRAHPSGSRRDHNPRRGPKPQERPVDILQRVPGNGVCADCGASDPDWASLNLGILLCIECSGVHRNLSVQISKVRSLTLDVRVWEPSVLGYFLSVGNTYANTIWEELLPPDSRAAEDAGVRGSIDERNGSLRDVRVKPKPNDPIAIKEKFIHAKYVEKRFVRKLKVQSGAPPMARQIWDAVSSNKLQLVLRLLITGDANANTTFEQAMGASESSRSPLVSLAGALSRKGSVSQSTRSNWSGPLLPTSQTPSRPRSAASSPLRGYDLLEGPSSNEAAIADTKDLQGCNLLHIACQIGDLSLVELLLQHGAQIEATDSLGRTPLHHCVLKGKNLCAKLLLTRGSKPRAPDITGKTPLEIAVEKGASADEELFYMLSEPNR
nr:ADP-ribosylation factor GTPase-activating protein AGD3-like isoform X2 [Physcomitrium patens]|eukprot:XP_024395266.1 ADP-ribosylation factor GTPase-activating protein AGD3-like isoform X2 [Physcomitrella patens]